ncbi:hypothetical protein GCM10020218_029480 [Dactylosporangium vinaceum]
MANAAYPAAANPAVPPRSSRRYTALQSAAAPSPTSAQNASPPSRYTPSSRPAFTRPGSGAAGGGSVAIQPSAHPARATASAPTRRNVPRGDQPRCAHRPPSAAPANPPMLYTAWNDEMIGRP